ncbi:hypothetical protein [Dehalobacter restrictus]|uniref:hypothetical protein n=1 Tax=Dehalobacter restrictus TaxID=55583 RepID=UPI00338FE396
MDLIFQYSSEDERQSLLTQNSGLYLIEEKNIKDGNFLIFSDVQRIEDRLASIEDTQDLILLKLEGVI